MNVMLNRGLLLLASAISVAIWLIVSIFTDEAIFQLVKSGYRFSDNYASVALRWPMFAIIWFTIVGCWMRLSSSVALRSIGLGISMILIWVVVLTALTIAKIDVFWGQTWTVLLVLQIAFWVLEVAVAMRLVYITAKPLFSTNEGGSTLLNGIISLTWLMAAKAVLLFCSPGILIRI